MKSKKIIFLLIIFLFAMSCVSAADNLTDNTLETDSNSAVQSDAPSIAQDTEIVSEINVTFDEKVYAENLTDITVDLPETAQGNLEVRINNYSIYNETITNKSVAIPIQLPPQKFPIFYVNLWPPYDSTHYKVTAFYNNVEINVTHDLIVMKYPQNHTPSVMIPEEVLQFSQSHYYIPAIMFPRSATGNVEIYLDGKLINKTNVTAPFVYFNESIVTSASLGIHNMSFVYSGDDYYNPCEGNITFNVTNVVMEIPKSIYLDHDDCISVRSLAKGDVSVYIDSKLVKKQALDKYGEFIYSLFDDITCGNHELKVVFNSKNFTRTKIANVNVTYDIDLTVQRMYVYGEDNTIDVYIPEDMNVKLFKVTINNKTASIKKSGQDLWVDISKLPKGNYTVNVTYLGDKKYYPVSVIDNFTVDYEITDLYDITFNDGSSIDLVLPSNAKGSLKVYLNDKLFKSVKLVKGKASIDMDNLNPGEYVLKVEYTGSDYDVSGYCTNLTVSPDLVYESYVLVGEKNMLYFEVPKSCKGKISAKIGSKVYSATIKNGIAKLDLSKLPVGDWDIDVKYTGSDGFKESYYVGVYVDYAPIKIKPISTKVSYCGEYKVKVTGKTGKAIKNAAVTFKINGKKVKSTKTNSKGIAKLKLPSKYSPKKYTITAIYKNKKLSKKVAVKHVISLKTSKIKKSSKLVLKASLKKSLKNKIVTFKFNGKTYKAKINSKGIAKVIVKKSALKNLKVGKKVTLKATYLKDTVKKSVRVKK